MLITRMHLWCHISLQNGRLQFFVVTIYKCDGCFYFFFQIEQCAFMMKPNALIGCRFNTYLEHFLYDMLVILWFIYVVCVHKRN